MIKKWYKSKRELVEENMELRTECFKKNVDSEENRKIMDKYILLLEKNTDKFNILEEYYNRCALLTLEKKELKRENASLMEECKLLKSKNEELTNELNAIKESKKNKRKNG